ncbi:ankyrin repeat and SOCS box protein 15 [Arapaima gigas]
MLGNMKVLLDNRASPHTTNRSGESPLLEDSASSSLSYLTDDSSSGEKQVPGNGICFKSAAGAEQICQKGWMFVHEAAKLGCPHIVLLLRNRGSVSNRDCHGMTPPGHRS